MVRTTEEKTLPQTILCRPWKVMWKSVKGFQIKSSLNKVQVARETRLLQSENENEAVLLILFSE